MEIDAHGSPQLRWVVNGAPMPEFDNQLFVGGGCEVGRAVNVQVTLSNGSGSVTESASLWCSGEADG